MIFNEPAGYPRLNRAQGMDFTELNALLLVPRTPKKRQQRRALLKSMSYLALFAAARGFSKGPVLFGGL